MRSNIALIKKELQLFTLDEQIEIIKFKINESEKIKRRTSSTERINKKFTLLNQLRTMRAKLINKNHCLEFHYTK